MDGQYSPKSSQLYVTNLFCPWKEVALDEACG